MKQHSTDRYKVVGVMSGTSLDGLDLAAVEFSLENGKWNFTLVAAETLPYAEVWKKRLQNAPLLTGEKLLELNAAYGIFIGEQVKFFLNKTGFNPGLIASHGHTVFHQPENHFTFQVGNGANIAATTGITTVSDFRALDVAMGGQGAPLVPVGDRFLFSEYDYCLNLGGFSNISFEKDRNRVAFDICPVNIVLNHFAEKQGLPFDKNGDLGRAGNINVNLLNELNNLVFYRQNPPKSLGREWVENLFLPVLNSFRISDEDKLRTVYEHIAEQIAGTVSGVEKGEGGGGGEEKMLVTGGGAFNTFLIELISGKTATELILPENGIINFKEALVFAFLGVLKMRNEINCLASVTGAKKDSSTGVVFRT